MISSAAASGFFGKMSGYATGKLQPWKMGDTLAGDATRGIANFTNKSGANAGAVFGGLAGAAGGILSADRDQTWYTGAAQGAFSGAQIASRGLSGRGLAGATLGAVYGMMSDDTSIMGGAFMGAAVGPGGRYMGAARQAMKRGKQASMIKTRKAPGLGSRMGFGLNAVTNAVKNDLGFGWRAGRGKSTPRGRSGVKSNSQPFTKSAGGDSMQSQMQMMQGLHYSGRKHEPALRGGKQIGLDPTWKGIDRMVEHGLSPKDVATPKGGFGVQNGIDFDALAAHAHKVNPV